MADIRLDTPCILCTCHLNKYGYGQRRYQGKQTTAHRVAYCEHHGLTLADIEGVHIRHACDVRNCINPYHLEPGTNADNMHDRDMRGRQARGERHGCAELTDEQAKVIKKRLKDGVPGWILALQFGVTPTTISEIKHGKSWGHVNA